MVVTEDEEEYDDDDDDVNDDDGGGDGDGDSDSDGDVVEKNGHPTLVVMVTLIMTMATMMMTVNVLPHIVCACRYCVPSPVSPVLRCRTNPTPTLSLALHSVATTPTLTTTAKRQRVTNAPQLA